MRKYLIWFAVLFVLSAGVTIKHEVHANQDAQTTGEHSTGSGWEKSPQADSNSSNPEHTLKGGWDLGYLFFGWPNGITIWALVLTLFAIAEQSGETARAAEASLKQANHFAASERPWVVVTATAYGYQRFLFGAINKGSWPAEIVSFAHQWEVIYSGEIIRHRDSRPKYNMREASYPRILFPGSDPYECGACNVGDILADRMDGDGVSKGNGLFIMYGCVRYYDLTSDRSEPPHETRFYFTWDNTAPNEVDLRNAPPAYVGYS